jgi:hypothetical protein
MRDVAAIVAVAVRRRHWPVREQLEAASISHGAHRKRQNN